MVEVHRLSLFGELVTDDLKILSAAEEEILFDDGWFELNLDFSSSFSELIKINKLSQAKKILIVINKVYVNHLQIIIHIF